MISILRGSPGAQLESLVDRHVQGRDRHSLMGKVLEGEADLGWPPQVMRTPGALKETRESSKPAVDLEGEEATRIEMLCQVSLQRKG